MKYRWLTLLFASYFFYINIKPVFTLILAGETLTTYLLTRLIDKTNVENWKKRLMVLNIIVILLPLVFYKYYNNINDLIFNILESLHLRWPLPNIKLILPIGISFYTFMAIGYIIDVYNEEIVPEKNIGILALFFSFFPTVLSGPIERANNMLPQFRAQKNLDYDMMVQGLKFMLWGYFMKLVVADRVGIYVDAIYNNISLHNGTSLLFASLIYPFQIYTDLGGYSLIAIGTAKVLGINVMQNFKRPFFATTMSEFWRRWHISLISWLTDYIFTPLSFGVRKYGVWGVVFALMVTFFISGIWHGASLTFIIWGLLQGLLLSIEALSSKRKTKLQKKYNSDQKWWYAFLGICTTFILFAFSLIFARVSNVKIAFIVIAKIFSNSGPLFIGTPSFLIYGGLGISMLLIKDLTDEYIPRRFLLLDNTHKVIRIFAYSSIIILILLIGVLDSGQFIYFQF
jgi:alginate O-acetyltransferase complex protein AlgI